MLTCLIAPAAGAGCDAVLHGSEPGDYTTTSLNIIGDLGI